MAAAIVYGVSIIVTPPGTQAPIIGDFPPTGSTLLRYSWGSEMRPHERALSLVVWFCEKGLPSVCR